MKITSVTVRRLKTTVGYNNVAIEATAQVPEDGDPRKTREDLDFWVLSEIEGKTTGELRADRDTLEWEIKSLQREKDRLAAEVARLKIEVSRAPAHTRPALKLVPEEG